MYVDGDHQKQQLAMFLKSKKENITNHKIKRREEIRIGIFLMVLKTGRNMKE